MSQFQAANDFDEVAACWIKNRAELDGFTTLFTFEDVGTQVPLESALAAYDGEKFYLRSIFSRPKLYFLNDSIWLQMTGERRATFSIDYQLCLDTQFGSYALKFIEQPKFRGTELGRSFNSLITYLFENDISFNFAFYLYENFANYKAGKHTEIEGQLRAFKILVDADKGEFLASGKFELPYDEKQLDANVAKLSGMYRDAEQRTEFAAQEVLQSRIATLLLKAVLLKKEAGTPEQKVERLIDFVHHDLSCVLKRELIICAKWLLGERIAFFDPVNAGPGYLEVPQKIHGMAWDLMLLRHVERICSGSQQGEFSIAYYASFDRRMIEVSNQYKNKGCLSPLPARFDRYFMLSEVDAFDWLRSVVGEAKVNAVFNDEAWEQRDADRPSNEEVFITRRALEYLVVKALAPK